MLDLLYLLVNYGYYTDLDEINDVISPLVSMLYGKSDDYKSRPSYEMSPENSSDDSLTWTIRRKYLVMQLLTDFFTIFAYL